MFTAVAASVALAFATVLLHYEVLSAVGTMRKRFSLPMRVELVLLTGAAIAAHLVCISMFAATYAWMNQHSALGTLVGEHSGNPSDFFYFSIACYTTLGFGEVYATGPMRIVAAMEGLNGLLLITWSASFAYASTSGLWDRD